MNGHNLDVTIEHLDERDRAILADLERFRLLSTRHLQRLHFNQAHANPTAAARACTRTLTRLRDHALITPLERRVGGVRRGSASYVWQLAARGERLLRRLRGDRHRRRYVEPSRRFVDHTLAIADLAIGLIETAREHVPGEAHAGLTIEHLGTEPTNWIHYLGPSGETRWVKPDLHVITTTTVPNDDGQTARDAEVFEDHAFLEVDRGTEHLPRILTKSAIYSLYAASGAYQARHGLFPTVVWLSADPARRRALRGAIAADARLPQDLFHVTSPEGYLENLTGTHQPRG